MTLLKQLVLVIVTLFVLLFVGTFAINVTNTRSYLDTQLQSISQDTANSLGLSISPHVLAHDMVTVESMINAVFDSGYYREVVVRDLDGKTVIERQATVDVQGVPQWFVRMFPLEPPAGQALVMAGWNQAGTVCVVGNPGYAYATLWGSSVQAFWWFLGSSLAVFVLGMVALRFVLRPLREVEAQAKAICDREFPVQARLPWTLELRSVVQAMNRMSSKVREMFDEQAHMIESLRKDMHIDATTGLPNRAFFDNRLHHLVLGEDFSRGALLIVELHDFKAYNARHGYQAANRLLQSVGRLMQEQIRQAPMGDSFIARLTGASFGVLLANVGDEEVRAFGQNTAEALMTLPEAAGMPEGVAHIGAALYHGQSMGDLLGDADVALRMAQSDGANAFHLHAPDPEERRPSAAGDWRTLLQGVLDHARIDLLVQPQRTMAGTAWGHEVLLRGRDASGVVIRAGEMLPLARRFGMALAFDRLVLERVFARLRSAPPDELGRVSINLFAESVRNPAMLDWVCEQLAELGLPEAARCVFELPENGALEDLDSLRVWIKRIKYCGAHTCLDHFGRGFSSYAYLSTLKLDFIKIDGSLVRGIDENRDGRRFVESVVHIARGLEIQVLAESVENDAVLAVLRELGVSVVQGYGVARPQPW